MQSREKKPLSSWKLEVVVFGALVLTGRCCPRASSLRAARWGPFALNDDVIENSADDVSLPSMPTRRRIKKKYREKIFCFGF